jgi:hypothetical protein
MRYPGIKLLPHTRALPLVLCATLTACEKDGGTPAFLRMEQAKVVAADGVTVIPSSITDLWVFADQQPVGVWQASRRIPALAEGPTLIQVIAGVRKNGITNDRIQYPFLATFAVTKDLVAGEETSVAPVFQYFNNVTEWSEGFEVPDALAFNTSEGDTAFHVFDADDPGEVDEVLSGEGSGGIVLDVLHPTFRAVSNADPAFPYINGPVFLELDHRSDTRFLVGVRYTNNGQSVSVPLVYVSPSALNDGTRPWKHVYIDLGSAWNSGVFTDRQFYIEAALENGASAARITLDNVRVIR